MTPRQRQGGIIIVLTMVGALALTIMPLPGWMAYLRPEFVTLTLIYWCLALPHRVSVGYGWLTGLVLDVAKGSLLGQHALALALVAYLTIRLHQRIRVFPLWQQAVSVMVLVLLQLLLTAWIRGAVNQAPDSWLHWLPALTSLLIWPPLFTLLRALRRRYQVR